MTQPGSLPSPGSPTPRQRGGLWLALGTLILGVAIGWWVGTPRKAVADAAPSNAAPSAIAVTAPTPEQAGRYLIRTAGCNDCHTDGFMVKGEQIPEADWLTGSPMGFRGPWGTTYASNLRLFARDLTEDMFVQILRQRKTQPPMPWASVNAMSDQDLKSMYRYLKSLGPKGERAPTYVPPTSEPKTPFLLFVPQEPAK